ncbi:MAG: hypothetical protein HPZ91_11240 [Lentisphaeria bacterium]|nr:hypothetical protein [Lentisphaeria bacterium]
MNRKPSLESLISLLDDEDENVAVSAMAELLNRESELGEVLAELQEGENALARRRAHQLQAAITLRRRRRAFAAKLDAQKVDLIDGLIDVHLQWYDNDSRPGLVQLWTDFRLEAQRFPQRTLENLSYFMRKSGFSAMAESTLHPEYYCIGPILENGIGASSILSGVVLEIADPTFKLQLVRVMGEFALYDGNGRLLLPGRNFQVCAAPGIEHCDFWDRRMLLRFASTTLFAAAVNSDSFRYVLTIAQALSGTEGDESLDYMPYPYYPAEEDGPEEPGSEESGRDE